MGRPKALSLVFLMVVSFTVTAELNWDMAGARDIEKILPVRKRAEVYNEILNWRLDSLLPGIMKEEGIDMWLVINFEYNEDPVYMTLVPRPAFNARRLSILVFHNSPKEGFKKLNACWWGKWTCGPMYEDLLTDRTKGGNEQYRVLAEYIEKQDPKKIGINYAEHWDYHDDFSHGQGLSAFHKAKLERALKPKYRKRLVSAEKICIRWFETRSQRELSFYRHLCGIAHDLIAEFFSNRVITPDITEVDAVRWWIRQRITDLGLRTWFHPTIQLQRSPQDSAFYGKDDKVIRRGDIVHCDVGVTYLGLNTDMQHNAYVCRIGETEPPEGIKKIMAAGNRVQEIMLSEFKEGRKGNEILKNSLVKAKTEGIEAKIYTHPVGNFGHASGTMIGRWDKQDSLPGTGEHPLHVNTVYAIEFGVTCTVPEWQDKKVYLGFEDQGVFTGNGANWVDGYPRSYYLIK